MRNTPLAKLDHSGGGNGVHRCCAAPSGDVTTASPTVYAARVGVEISGAEVQRALAELRRVDPDSAEGAKVAVESLTWRESEDEPVVVNQYRLQQFLWYELTQKWMASPDELIRNWSIFGFGIRACFSSESEYPGVRNWSIPDTPAPRVENGCRHSPNRPARSVVADNVVVWSS